MYFNTFDQIASSVSGSATFSVSFTAQNFDIAAVQVSWSGHSGGNATFGLTGSIDNTNVSSLTSSVITMTSGSGSQMYNICNIGYRTIYCNYAPGSNVDGVVDVWISRKSRR